MSAININKDKNKILAFKYVGYERTRWRIFQKRVTRSKFAILLKHDGKT